MLVRAAGELGLDPAGSWMVGDILDDVEAGRRAGCRTVLIDNGNETEWVRGPLREPHVKARDRKVRGPKVVSVNPGLKKLALHLADKRKRKKQQ